VVSEFRALRAIVIRHPLTASNDAGDSLMRGFGLGLYIARHITLSHGGTIGVNSDGDSTTFTVSLLRFTIARGRTSNAALERAVDDARCAPSDLIVLSWAVSPRYTSYTARSATMQLSPARCAALVALTARLPDRLYQSGFCSARRVPCGSFRYSMPSTKTLRYHFNSERNDRLHY